MSGSSPLPDLAALPAGPGLAALLDTIDPDTLGAGNAIAVLRAWSRQCAHDHARLARVIARVADLTRRAGMLCGAEGEWAGAEIAAALTWSDTKAGHELAFAETLLRLPAVLAAFEAGLIDHGKAWVFADVLGCADLTQARIDAVCAAVLPSAPRLTAGRLRHRLVRAVLAVDPEWSARRYRRALTETRVHGYLAADGTAVITATGLPAADAAAACARVDALAARLRRAGHPATLAQIRARVFVRLLDGSLTGLNTDEIVAALLAEAGIPASGPAPSTPTITDPTAAPAPPGHAPPGHAPPSHTHPAAHGAAPDHERPADHGADPDDVDVDAAGHGETDVHADVDTEAAAHPASTHADQVAAHAHVCSDGCVDHLDVTPADLGGAGGVAAGRSAGATARAAVIDRDPASHGDPASHRDPIGHGAGGATPHGGRPDHRRPNVRVPDEASRSTGTVDLLEPDRSPPADRMRTVDGAPGAGSGRDGPTVPRAVGVEIRIGLATLLGLDHRPGEIPRLGPVLPEVASELVAAQLTARWRFAIVDADGYLLLAGLLRRRPAPDRPLPPAQRVGGLVEIHVTEDALAALATGPGDHPGWAAVIKELADRHARRGELTAELAAHPDNRFARAALARHVQIRDRTCVAPGCHRPAVSAQLDHTVDHARGGLTDPTNTGPLCLLHHARKHHSGWALDQPVAGHFRWTSPLGERYFTRGEAIRPVLPDPLDHPDGISLPSPPTFPSANAGPDPNALPVPNGQVDAPTFDPRPSLGRPSPPAPPARAPGSFWRDRGAAEDPDDPAPF